MPSIETMFLIVLAAAAAFGLFGWWWHRRNVIHLYAENHAYRNKLRKLKRLARDAESDLKELEQELVEPTELKRQVAGYQELVRTVQRERDTWRDLYYSQATGHDNAQRWMMRVNQQLAQQVTQLGGKPKLDPVIQELRAEFQDEHGENILDHASGKATESHAAKVEQENAQLAAIDGLSKENTTPK